MISYKDPIRNLQTLVGFKSISNSHNLDLCEWVADACASRGLSCVLEKDSHCEKANVIATIGPQVEGGLIISGHLDVVPTDDQPWTTDPFLLTEKNGLLYGRGTSDMKGFIAATLAALPLVDLTRLQKPLVLIWTYDEEIGCKGSAHFAMEHKTLPDWYPREAWIGEPTNMQIFRMHPGHVSFKISVSGKAAHSSKPDLGTSAIHAASHIVLLLEEFQNDLKKERRLENFLERPFVTLNVGMIRGGQAVNIIPDYCEIVVGYRPLPGDDPKAVYQRFLERLKSIQLEQGIHVEVNLHSLTPALLTDQGTPLEKLLLTHAHTPQIGAASFATDAGNLSTIGIQSLVFGPGSIDVAHRADEFIDANALQSFPAVIADIIRKRCE